MLAFSTLAGCASSVKPYLLDEHFSEQEALSGSTSSESRCANTPNGIWVKAGGHADCLRYYGPQITGTADKLIVYLDGDKLAGSPGHVHVEKTYAMATPLSLEGLMAEDARRIGIPVVYLARPGTMGSSGNQNDRRQQAETLEINAALNWLRDRYQVHSFGLAGQSGGGGLVASLIAERSDVLCAVSSSGVTAVKLRAAAMPGGDPTGTPDDALWDPIDQVARIRPAAGFRMFVLSDMADQDVSFASQEAYVRAANERGLGVVQITMHGHGQLHHGLAAEGREVVGECMTGVDSATIVARHQAKPASGVP